MPEEVTEDLGVTLNFNLLVTVGGRERREREFRNLLKQSGFDIVDILQGEGVISVITTTKGGENHDVPSLVHIK